MILLSNTFRNKLEPDFYELIFRKRYIKGLITPIDLTYRTHLFNYLRSFDRPRRIVIKIWVVR